MARWRAEAMARLRGLLFGSPAQLPFIPTMTAACCRRTGGRPPYTHRRGVCAGCTTRRAAFDVN